jgi:hypothetical protein
MFFLQYQLHTYGLLYNFFILVSKMSILCVSDLELGTVTDVTQESVHKILLI